MPVTKQLLVFIDFHSMKKIYRPTMGVKVDQNSLDNQHSSTYLLFNKTKKRLEQLKCE